ncbi:MAG TPA: phosphatase PAP2 family protein [Allosphingosinicella sp.]|jgi:membrane-associated phospholipid phosphatase
MLAFLQGVSDWLYLLLNGLSGRSWLLDSLIALPVDNPLVKAGPIGAAFVYAWHSGRDEAEAKRRRAILLVTVGSLILVLTATKTIGQSVFLPRPFVHSQTAWHLSDGKLVESPVLPYRGPQEGSAKARHEDLARGEIAENDLSSFPSDHAGFFVALALGIFLACGPAGAAALGWTLVAVLLPRIITGMHSPLDIAGGGAIGAVILLGTQWLARRHWPARMVEPLSAWTLRHGAIAAALLFLVAFEATNALENVRDLAGTAGDIVGGITGA